MSSSSAFTSDAVPAPPLTIKIVNLANTAIFFTDIDAFIKEIKKYKIPATKTFMISFEEGENIQSPLPFIRINDIKIPRWFIQLQMGTAVPNIEKLALFIRSKNYYWLFAFIQIYRPSDSIYESHIENFFRRDYDAFSVEHLQSAVPQTAHA